MTKPKDGGRNKHAGHRIEASLGLVVCHTCKKAIAHSNALWPPQMLKARGGEE